MSCYSVPKRLLHIVFGGSAIWLGTTFCSPLAATDFEMQPTPASAPEALSGPEQHARQSSVPAALLETEEATHWDNGPVVEEGLCESDCVWEDSYCDEYAYDGYGEAAVQDDMSEESVDSGVDYADEDFGYEYDYDKMYAHDETMDAEEETESFDEEDYSYDFEDEYDQAEEFAADYEEIYGVDEVEEDSYAYEQEDYDDYGYDEEYACDYEDMSSDEDRELSSLEDQAEEVAETPVVEEAGSIVEDDFTYEFDDYEMYYGYEDDSAEETEEASTIEQKVAEDPAERHESEWEDYHYGDELQNDSEEYASDSQPVTEEAHVEEAWADEYEYKYDAYKYEAYEYEANEYDANEYDANEYDANEYDMEGADETEAVNDEPAETLDESYDHVDPMDYYGYEYEVPTDWMEMEEETEVNLDLFAWQPAELLDDADCSLIRSIEGLSGEPATLRRVCLNEYIEALGFEAIDFAYRYEDATDADVLALADDLPGAAAFLASYRLVEQGQIDMDDAVLLLDGALSGLSLDWIEDVGRIAAIEEISSASHPVVEAMAAAATHSIAGVSSVAAAVSERLANLPWAEFSDRLEEVRWAFRPMGSDDSFTF